MKISANFDAREFLPKHIWDRFGSSATWFVNPRIVRLAEFYKSFFTTYYKNKLGNDKVKSVVIEVNTWLFGGAQQWRGLRTDQCTQGATYSQHKFMNAFDCEIFVIMADGKKIEVDYNEVHQIIKGNETEFMANGLTTVEDIKIATGWLHSDMRYIPEQKHILVVGA